MRFRLSRRWPAASLGLGAAAVAVAVATGVVAQSDRGDLDKPVKDFKATDIMSGKEVALSDYKGKPVVLSFISYTCGTSWRYEKRMGKMMSDYGKKGVTFLNVNSNANNTEEGIKKYVEARNLSSVPLLKDKNNQVADYLSTRVTPTFYVIDKEGVLRYRGAFDDNADETKVAKNYVVPALDAVLAGKPVEVKEARPFG